MNINEPTQEYIRQHATEDVRKLALQGTKDSEVDMTVALQQIAGRQTARRKLPSWAVVDGIVYPPHLNMEQCSSELTARYKAEVAGKGERFADLTGGFGVDFYWMSQGYSERVYVEQDAELCAIAGHNFRLLGLECSVRCCDTAKYLTEVEHAATVFLDPARRDEHGGRTYGIADSSPNVLELLPQLVQKADRIVLKLSPMLDWRKAVSDLQQPSSHTSHLSPLPAPRVIAVHIVSVDNECKELLIETRNEEWELRNGKEGMGNKLCETRVVCVNLLSNGERQEFTFGGLNYSLTSHPLPHTPHLSPITSHPSPLTSYHYLYEPNASIMKAGCFAELEQRYPVCQVASNSHLFLSSDAIEDFPGRRFEIMAISSMKKQEIKEIVYQKFTTMKSANIAVRNFPMTADQLRKKLKLRDGGDTYIFATTLADGQHRLFICRKC